MGLRNHWRLVAAAVAVLTACGPSGVGSEAEAKRGSPNRRLNVLLVTIDTLRADRLGCYGNTRIRTPNLDELATLAEILQQQGWETAAFVGAAVLKNRFGFEQGFAVYDDQMSKPDPEARAVEFPERRAGEVVDRAVGWLATHSGKPWSN